MIGNRIKNSIFFLSSFLLKAFFSESPSKKYEIIINFPFRLLKSIFFTHLSVFCCQNSVKSMQGGNSSEVDRGFYGWRIYITGSYVAKIRDRSSCSNFFYDLVYVYFLVHEFLCSPMSDIECHKLGNIKIYCRNLWFTHYLRLENDVWQKIGWNRMALLAFFLFVFDFLSDVLVGRMGIGLPLN